MFLGIAAIRPMPRPDRPWTTTPQTDYNETGENPIEVRKGGRLVNQASKKEMLREMAIRKRNAMNLSEISISNRNIIDNLLLLPEYRVARSIFCYIGSVVDIETMPILIHAWKEGKAVIMPQYTSAITFRTCEVDGPEWLHVGRYGVLEPKPGCPKVEDLQVDFALIPSICCDRFGHRIGMGDGIYDRFLIQNQLHPIVSLCRESLLLEEVPADRWDVPLDIVVTEKTFYRRAVN